MEVLITVHNDFFLPVHLLPLYYTIPTFNDPERSLLKTLWEKNKIWAAISGSNPCK